MAKCAHCGKFMIGGKKQGSLRFCNEACYQKGFLVPLAEYADPDEVEDRLRETHEQNCPVCSGPGPVDVYTSYTAWSILVMTSWQDHPQFSCARCGRKAIRRGLAVTSLFGWWGFPFGLIVTPWQLINGVRSLAKARDSSQPSEQLQELIKLQFASELQAQAGAEQAK